MENYQDKMLIFLQEMEKKLNLKKRFSMNKFIAKHSLSRLTIQVLKKNAVIECNQKTWKWIYKGIVDDTLAKKIIDDKAVLYKSLKKQTGTQVARKTTSRKEASPTLYDLVVSQGKKFKELNANIQKVMKALNIKQ